MPSKSDDSNGSDSSFLQGPLIEVKADGELIQKLTGGLPEEILGMGADWVRQKRLELVAERLQGTAEKLRNAGIEDPERVTLDTVSPWIEGASIEEDPDLHEMWESFLANAGDPRPKRKQTHRSFVRILKQIEAPEQKVLEALYYLDDPRTRAGQRELPIEYPHAGEIIDAVREIGYQFDPSVSLMETIKINLVRLGLCSRQRRTKSLEVEPDTSDIRVVGLGGLTDPDQLSIEDRPALTGDPQHVPESSDAQIGPPRIHINIFGHGFYDSCQPPEVTPNTEED